MHRAGETGGSWHSAPSQGPTAGGTRTEPVKLGVLGIPRQVKIPRRERKSFTQDYVDEPTYPMVACRRSQILWSYPAVVFLLCHHLYPCCQGFAHQTRGCRPLVKLQAFHVPLLSKSFRFMCILFDVWFGGWVYVS